MEAPAEDKETVEVGLNLCRSSRVLCVALIFSNNIQLVQVNKASTGSEEEGDEPAPPEPFEWKEEED